MINFWKWFFRTHTDKDQILTIAEDSKIENKSGIFAYWDKWLLVHLIIGIILMLIIPVRLNEAAKSILLPLAGIFIGLTFAWGGNAVSLMQSEEINLLADHRPGGLKEYVFTFQSAILMLLVTMVLWGLAGLDVFEILYDQPNLNIIYKIIEVLLFTLISLSLRDCWHVVMGAQTMILLRRAIKKQLETQDKKDKAKNGESN